MWYFKKSSKYFYFSTKLNISCVYCVRSRGASCKIFYKIVYNIYNFVRVQIPTFIPLPLHCTCSRQAGGQTSNVLDPYSCESGIKKPSQQTTVTSSSRKLVSKSINWKSGLKVRPITTVSQRICVKSYEKISQRKSNGKIWMNIISGYSRWCIRCDI